MNPLSLREGANILREMDLGKIQRRAERPFTLLVVGGPSARRPVVAAIETGVGASRVVELSAPLPVGLEIRQPALALLVSAATVEDADVGRARRQLTAAGVPTVDVRLGASAAIGVDASVTGDGVAGTETAPVPRREGPTGVLGDEAREVSLASRTRHVVWLPSEPNPEDLSRLVGPAAVERIGDDDDATLSLARGLPFAREAYVAAVIEETSRVNAIYAFSTGLAQTVPVLGLPLALADVVVLTKNQIVMAYKVALAAGQPAATRVLLTEVLGVIGGGLLFRQIARELVGLAPGIGIVPKVAIAYAGTRVVGAVVRAWALEGRTLEGSELRRMYHEAVEGGKRAAAELQARADRVARDRSMPKPSLPMGRRIPTLPRRRGRSGPRGRTGDPGPPPGEP